MANYGGASGGHTGPYWRRKLGTTLPGERTQAELNAVNSLRAKAGQAPLGGPVGDNTRSASAAPAKKAIRVDSNGMGTLARSAAPSGRVPRSPILSNLATSRVVSTHGRGKGQLMRALAQSKVRRAIFNG